ncbi:hypothetical protein PV04_09560 [Phialophora macrospora]|uniref:Uncharacterized protein n=1 Tax=Phialophora macrospora TaxID=1851006 RepID=A0A0D2DR15_9EURO|nr:hypothetical protein PV04_09560 [Phialophora macrospora]
METETISNMTGVSTATGCDGNYTPITPINRAVLEQLLVQIKESLDQAPSLEEAQVIITLLGEFLYNQAQDYGITLDVGCQPSIEIVNQPIQPGQPHDLHSERSSESPPTDRSDQTRCTLSVPPPSPQDPRVSPKGQPIRSSSKLKRKASTPLLRTGPDRRKTLKTGQQPTQSQELVRLPTGDEDSLLEEYTLRLERESTPVALAREKVNRLTQKMLAIEVPLIRPTKTGRTLLKFSPDEVRAVLNCTLQEVMGLQGLDRLNGLITDYKSLSPGLADAGAATRAERAARSDDTPIEARPLFIAYSQLDRALCNAGGQLKRFRVLNARLEFIDAYKWLVRSVDDKLRDPSLFDESLSQQLRDSGWRPTTGCNWKTVIRNYLADKLQVKRQAINTALEHSAGLHQLASHLGPPMICLVPDTIVTRLKYWNLQKMELVWPLIRTEFPIISDMATWLEVHVFNKIRVGAPIEVNTIRLEGERSIYQRMVDAVEIDETSMTTT